MGSVKEEITRLETAKKDIETAIETCGVNVPDTELIDTYASYIRQIPSAVFSGLNVDPVGGADQFIQSIKQTNGLIEATVGGLVSTSNSGLVPKADGSAGVINNQSDDYVLTYKGGTIDWYKLPANAFKNDDNNTTYTLSGTLNGNAYDVTLTPSSGSATGAKVPAMGAASSSAAGTAGLVPAPAKNKHNSFLRGDGTWVVPDNTTYSVMTGATASAAGKSGLVPQPAKGDQGKFLSGAGTWTALPSLSITDSESGNAVTDVEVSGHGITLKRGTTFSVNGHKHSSDDITALTSYIKATTVAAIASTDSLNSALGKLELKADTAYNLVKGAYDGDGTIENLAEILKVLEGISDTDTIQAIVGKYLPLAGGMMTGNITFDTNRMIRWHQSDSYSISCPTGGDGAYLLLKAHNGITAKKRLSIYTNAESLPNTKYNLYTDGSLYAASAVFGGNTKITGGSDLTLQASSGAQGDAGDIVFSDYSGAELGRIWLDSTASQALSLRYGANDAVKRILHSGNSSVSKSGQTLTVKINGVEQSITNSTYSTLPNPYNISFKDTSNNTVTYNGSSALDLTGGIYYAVTSSTAALLTKQGGTSTAASVWNPKTSWTKVWGQNFVDSSISSDTGDILYYLRASEYGSGTTELCVVIDGDYYAGVGQYKVWHAGNLTKVSQLSNDAGYLTSLPSHVHTYIQSKDNYTFTASTLPNSFDWGVSAGFVADNAGYGSYGSVLTVRTYTGGGGTLQLYAPYSKTYGGTRLKARFGDYDKSNGNSWTDLKEIAWTSDIPTKTSQLTNDSGYVTGGPYLALSGGTMTGTPHISMPASAATISDSQPFGITYGRIQSYGTMTIAGDTDGSTTEFVNITAGYGVASATAANGLSIGYNSLKWKDQDVIHSGNISSHALHYNGFWSSTSGQSIDSATGMTFVYSAHGAPASWGVVSTFAPSASSDYKFQLFAEGYSASGLYYRSRSSDFGKWTDWRTVLDSSNYTTYTVKKDGTGASGTWGINITGSAGSAGSSTTCSYPAGFTSRGTNDWSGVAGTLATDWSVNGADIMFKYDGSKLNVITDGRFYQGIDIYGASKRVLDEYDISNTTWGTASIAKGLASTGYGNSNLTYYQTDGSFFGNSGWSHYIIANHGNGETYYNYTIALPFWDVPKYKRLEGGTGDGWHTFITSENISSQSVNYAASAGSAGDANTLDGYDSSAFAKIGTYNNLTHSGNEFTFASSAFSGDMWINYRTASGSLDGAITGYYFGDGKGGNLAKITSGNFSGNSNSASKLILTSCYGTTTNGNLWSTIKTGTASYLGTATVYEVYNNGGPDTYGEVLDIVSVHNSHWQPQLWFGSGKAGRLRYRNKDYNDNSWGDWKTVAWTSEIPSVGNGTVTINQGGASKGSFTLNQSTAATINLTDTNYYPTAFSWTGGTTAGPKGSLTGVGMTAVSFGAIPSASGSASGIVTTDAQTFAGEKTFHQIRLRQPYTSGSVNYGGYLYFGDGSYAYIAELSDDKLYYRASGGHYFEGLNHNFAPVLVGTIYRKPGETTYSITSNSIGVDSSSGATKNIGISVSRSRAGKYAVTLTNNTPTPVRIHAPVITSSHGDWGGGSCHESPFAYLDHNSTCVFPKLLSAGKTLSFNIICGRIHTQGNWSTGDFTKSDDNSGFICSIYASYSGNTATG